MRNYIILLMLIVVIVCIVLVIKKLLTKSNSETDISTTMITGGIFDYIDEIVG